MAIDVNGIFGRWPVRTLGIWEPGEYVRQMDRFGIERALVSSTAALLDNTTLGNDRIASLVRTFPDRFLGACVIDPQASAARAVSEARRCLELGFVALRLYAGMHGYLATESDLLDPVMAEAKRAEVPVLLTLRVSASTGFPDTPASSARLLATRYPEVPLLVCGAVYTERLALTRAAIACPNLYLETSQMQCGNGVQMLCEALGATRILFGSAMGVQYVSPALARINSAEIPEEDRTAVLEGNARRLLKIQ